MNCCICGFHWDEGYKSVFYNWSLERYICLNLKNKDPWDSTIITLNHDLWWKGLGICIWNNHPRGFFWRIIIRKQWTILFFLKCSIYWLIKKIIYLFTLGFTMTITISTSFPLNFIFNICLAGDNYWNHFYNEVA